jgi:hypothetical protein
MIRNTIEPSRTTLSITYDGVSDSESITVYGDTISYNCGNADGTSFCGSSTLQETITDTAGE